MIVFIDNIYRLSCKFVGGIQIETPSIHPMVRLSWLTAKIEATNPRDGEGNLQTNESKACRKGKENQKPRGSQDNFEVFW